MSVPAQVPAGWYPDPDDGGLLRYWTGSVWTEDRRPAVEVVQRVAVVAAPVVPGRGLGIAGFVLSLLGPWIGWLGLILASIGYSKSKRSGHGNGLAVAGIWIGSVECALLVLLIVIPVALQVAANAQH